MAHYRPKSWDGVEFEAQLAAELGMQSPDALQRFPAIHLQDDQMGLGEAKLKQTTDAVWRRKGSKSMVREIPSQKLARLGLAHNDQDPLFHSNASPS